MTPKLLLPVFFLVFSQMASAQDTESQTPKRAKWGLTAETPSVQFMNFCKLNNSNELVANARNVDWLYSFHLYIGDRDKFFFSFGLGGHRYSRSASYNYTNAANESYSRSVNTSYKNVKFDFHFFKPVFARGRNTLYVQAGLTTSKCYLDIWKINPTMQGGVEPAEFMLKQKWNLNLGMMYDFNRATIGRHEISTAFKIGYDLPLARAQWWDGQGRVASAEKVNLGGFYASFVINVF